MPGAGTPEQRASRVVTASKELRRASTSAGDTPATLPLIVECGGADVKPDEQARLITCDSGCNAMC